MLDRRLGKEGNGEKLARTSSSSIFYQDCAEAISDISVLAADKNLNSSFDDGERKSSTLCFYPWSVGDPTHHFQLVKSIISILRPKSRRYLGEVHDCSMVSVRRCLRRVLG